MSYGSGGRPGDTAPWLREVCCVLLCMLRMFKSCDYSKFLTAGQLMSSADGCWQPVHIYRRGTKHKPSSGQREWQRGKPGTGMRVVCQSWAGCAEVTIVGAAS